MERYGTDKPDLRFGMEFQDLTDLLREADFRISGSRGTGARIRVYVRQARARRCRASNWTRSPSGEERAAGALWVRRTEDGVGGQFALGSMRAGPALHRGDGSRGRRPLRGRIGHSERSAALTRATSALDGRAADRRVEPRSTRCAGPRRAARAARPRSASAGLGSPISRCSSRIASWSGSSRCITRSRCRSRRMWRCSLHRDAGRAARAARSPAYDVVLNGTELGGGAFASTIRRCSRASSGLLGIDERGAQRASGFCSRGSAPARRRTAASRSASTASRCSSSSAGDRCATSSRFRRRPRRARCSRARRRRFRPRISRTFISVIERAKELAERVSEHDPAATLHRGRRLR